MQPTLADSLEVQLPSLPSVLASANVIPHLRRLTRMLPPIPNCGFEVSLTDSTRIDLQQCITGREGAPQRLRSHLRAELPRILTRRAAVYSNWQRVDDFLAEWSDPSAALQEFIAELWLEFDQTPALSYPFLPAIFFGFHRKRHGAPDLSVRYEVAQRALDLLLGRPSWVPYQMNVQRCFEACREPMFVSYIGLMPGRALPALRVNIRGLLPDALMGYLQDMGWPGAKDEAVEMMARLHRFVDRITVCLDVGKRIYPQLGFECILAEQPASEPRWATFLDYLIEHGLCTAAKRDALLAWPGLANPTTTSARWPDHLIQYTLLEPPDRFTALERRLSHIKITCGPQHESEAKAYFGFLHRWLQPAPDEKAGTPAGVRVNQHEIVAPLLDNDGLTMAIQRAIAFLLEARNDTGWWRDFSGSVGATQEWRHAFGWSDEWVTAYAGAVLAAMPDKRARQAASYTWSLLTTRRQPTEGWGHNGRAPVDADSTSWGLRLAIGLGVGESPRAQQARRILEEHMLRDGGITTYREEACPRPSQPNLIPGNSSHSGWCQTAHLCVTAAAAALENERPRDFLRRMQCSDGSWKAYWWGDNEYSTALAAEALALTGRAADQLRVQAAMRWALGRIGANGAVKSLAHRGDSAFATAWCMRLLALAKDFAEIRQVFERAVRWLLRQQRTDGAWPPSACLLAPRPDVIDPDESDVPPAASLDDAGIFTTVTVLPALVAAQSLLLHPGCNLRDKI